MMDEKMQAASFEVKMSRLEEIVKRMESTEASLDEMLKLFEEGSALVSDCSRVLREAEQRVSVLTKGKDESYVEVDFDRTEG